MLFKERKQKQKKLNYYLSDNVNPLCLLVVVRKANGQKLVTISLCKCVHDWEWSVSLYSAFVRPEKCYVSNFIKDIKQYHLILMLMIQILFSQCA